MEIPNLEGRQIPDVRLHTRIRDESIGGENPFKWEALDTGEFFAGKRVVLFGLPGAFTPTCDTHHLPGYEEYYRQFTDLGIDTVCCISVNDAFVMNQWGKKLGVENVVLLPDGSGDFARELGVLVKKDNLGFGARSWRYSAYLDDGEIKKAFLEPGFGDNISEDPFEVSDAETMLEYLQEAGGE